MEKSRYRDKLRAAFLSRAAGCTLGAPVEGWSSEAMESYAREIGTEFPRTDFWPSVPNPDEGKFWEAHVVELPNGELVGAIRHEPGFSTYLTRSCDGGVTWAKPEFLVSGAPPALLLHSSGVLVMSYSWRGEKPGQRMAFSRDGGRSWSLDWILRDD